MVLRQLRNRGELPIGESMKTVKLTEVLDYYDGIQLFAARDPIGGHYVGDMIDTVGDFDRYLVVGVRPERLDDFRSGQVDLRTLLLECPDGEWYITVADGTINAPLTLVSQREPLAETEYLPDEGFFLEAPTPVSESDINQAVQRGDVVTHTGQVELANQSTGEWRLLTHRGPIKGETFPGGPKLDGIQIGRRYRFQCAEVPEPDFLSRNQRVLYLQRIETT